MRKKILALLLALLTAFLAFACGETPENPNKPNGPDDEQTTPIYDAVTKAPDYQELTTEALAKYTTYYFDSGVGVDSSKGLSEGKPKKTIEEAERIISSVTVDKPTRILFKAGSVWSGSLEISGFEAKEETPLIVSTYGVTADSKYATIKDGTTLIKIKGGNVRFSGFELTSVNGKQGVSISTAKGGAMKNVVVSNNYIHDINYDWKVYENWLNDSAQDAYADERNKLPNEFSDEGAICRKPELVCNNSNFQSYGNGGIFTSTATDDIEGPSWIENCWIENNLIERVARSGMFLDSNWCYRPGKTWGKGKWCEEDGVEYGTYPNKNMVVRNNVINYVGGDSIVLLSSVDSWIEGNVSYHAAFLSRKPYYNAGIWPHSCTGVVMQYNEASWTHKDHGSGDGEGFDIDIGNRDILFQYNYAHHNRGGAILLCNDGSTYPLYDKYGNYVKDEDGYNQSKYIVPYWGDITMRNNVFTDNDMVITASSHLYDLEFYNNTVITSSNTDGEVVLMTGINWSLCNNIFASRNNVELTFTSRFANNVKFENNVFWNIKGANINDAEWISTPSNNVEIDPGFMTVSSLNGYENSKLFKPSSESVFANAKRLTESNKYDICGDDVAGLLYVGAIGKNN